MIIYDKRNSEPFWKRVNLALLLSANFVLWVCLYMRGYL